MLIVSILDRLAGTNHNQVVKMGIQVLHKQAMVAYSAAEMYSLVNDIAAYPSFVPGCSAASVVEQGAHSMTAQLEFSAKGIKQGFITRNQLEPDQKITLQLVEGPFKQLQGEWSFESLADGGCQISLDLQFEFESGWLAMLFEAMFSQVADKLVDCFCQRASEVYANDRS